MKSMRSNSIFGNAASLTVFVLNEMWFSFARLTSAPKFEEILVTVLREMLNLAMTAVACVPVRVRFAISIFSRRDRRVRFCLGRAKWAGVVSFGVECPIVTWGYG